MLMITTSEKKIMYRVSIILFILIFTIGCSKDEGLKMRDQVNIIFLHHSTGNRIWRGDLSKIADKLGFKGDVMKWFEKYNEENSKNYVIEEFNFPKESPYGWNNYPFDYYNIWVKNAGEKPFKEEPTLEILTKKYDIIIFKHCFPVSNIKPDTSDPDIESSVKTLGNYKLQYEALKEKLLEFPDTKFLLWTPTAQLKSQTNEEEARRADKFYHWVRDEWDTKGDNIFLWDFRSFQVEGGIYFKDEYADAINNSHPNRTFSARIAPYFCNRIIDVIENKGDITSIDGKSK